MAYNLESLVRILEQILQPDQQRWNFLDHKRPHIESLWEKASSLKQILETFPLANGRGIESLETQIRDAAHEAEDIIERHMVDQMLSEPGGKSFTISSPDLQQVIRKLDSAMYKMKNIMDETQMANTSLPGGVSFTPDSSSRDDASSLPDSVSLTHHPSSKNIVVGLDEDILHLKDRLTGDQRKLEIIAIVGMGGIGKTFLALNLYNDQHVVSHFDTLAWITVLQDYNEEAILLGLLRCIIGKRTDEVLQEKYNDLGLILHKSLFGRRYLIVLDDIWGTHAWDKINMFFPRENEGSRIILTTRESNVAKYVDSSNPQHHMRLLDEPKSWNLLQQTVFGKKNCPAELERIGRHVASSCGGLPLAIHVIGGLLSRAKRTRDSWEHVAYDIRGAVAEKPEDDKSLEEEAEDYLKALVDRNLIVVTQKKSNGKAKNYSIHDLLRDLCIKKADQVKFLNVINRRVHHVQKDLSSSLRRVSVHPSYHIRDIYAAKEFMSLARSFLCNGSASRGILSPVFSELRLLHVLDVFGIEFHQFPAEILQLVNLRFLAFYCNSKYFPSAISRLWNLQTLIVQSRLSDIYVPTEIWEMSELRHIKFKETTMIIDYYYRKDLVQEKLQTISILKLYDLREKNFLQSIPNIKNLCVKIYRSPSGVVDLSNLHKLETLKCWRDQLLPTKFVPEFIFPPCLRKLTLKRCIIPWRVMKVAAALPNLEVLKIRRCPFQGQETRPENEQDWEVTEEVFCSLRFLLLENLTLVHWRADETNFPRLRHLVIRQCHSLKEIPGSIGEIPTLELIEVDKYSRSAVASARRIQREQQECGNYDIEVRIF
ncbi:Apoptotic ATPase [Handroanthus impetiginosus]|uniref:Apoptotic ATPase n=1 Tax=Handroanthus impetiginosus TaxID=429701 RepID=A0A2G9GK56_9LAMI|nr:Apoptotic ATPase [Handroanthus impetiginosus]